MNTEQWGKHPERGKTGSCRAWCDPTGSARWSFSGWFPPHTTDNSWNIGVSYYCLMYVTEPSQIHPKTKLNAEKNPQLLRGHLDQSRPESEPVWPSFVLRWSADPSNPETLQIWVILYIPVFFNPAHRVKRREDKYLNT